jgi:hypothetical protein
VLLEEVLSFTVITVLISLHWHVINWSVKIILK